MGGGGGSSEVRETSQEKSAAEVAMKEWSRYKNVYVPLENEWMEDIRVTEPERNQIVGEAAGLTNQRFNTLQRDVVSRVAPGSGKFTMATTGLNAQRGASVGRSMATAASLADDADLAGLQTSVALGRGQATDTQLGLGGIARRSVDNATSDAFDRWNSSNNKADTIGGLAGTIAYDTYNSTSSKDEQ